MILTHANTSFKCEQKTYIVYQINFSLRKNAKIDPSDVTKFRQVKETDSLLFTTKTNMALAVDIWPYDLVLNRL